MQKPIYPFYQFEIFATIAAKKNKENNKKICDIFHHDFKILIVKYVTSEVLKRFYFALFDDGLLAYRGGSGNFIKGGAKGYVPARTLRARNRTHRGPGPA